MGKIISQLEQNLIIMVISSDLSMKLTFLTLNKISLSLVVLLRPHVAYRKTRNTRKFIQIVLFVNCFSFKK